MTLLSLRSTFSTFFLIQHFLLRMFVKSLQVFGLVHPFASIESKILQSYLCIHEAVPYLADSILHSGCDNVHSHQMT